MSENNATNANVNAAEKAEKVVTVTVKLTSDQVKALTRLDLLDGLQTLAEKSIATSIRGKFNYYADKAEEYNGKLYDQAIARGFKQDKDKGSFVTGYMKEIRDIKNAL